MSSSKANCPEGSATPAASSRVAQIASDLVELNNNNRLSSAAASAAPASAASSHSAAAVVASAASRASAASAAPSDAKCNFLSEVEQAILRSNVPVEINESEEITVLGQRGIWANKEEVNNWKGVIPIDQYVINEDSQPEVITKRTEQKLEYVQELAIRYLRPPTPPPPGEILIQQECNSLTPPAPPLIIRQQPARPETPEPLVIREAPPQPPPQVCQKVITISGKRLPPPPRKVVIERLAPLPCKPQSVIVERWLPYSEVKRRVIYQRTCEPDPVACKPKNVIVQWEAPQVVVKKEVKYLGQIRANPAEYVQRYGATLKLSKDLPDFVLEIKTPEGLTLAAEHEYNNVHVLEGDLAAFKLVDLDREGLSEYRAQLQKLGINYVGAEAAAKLAEANADLSGLGSAAGARSAASLHSPSLAIAATAQSQNSQHQEAEAENNAEAN